MCLEVGSDFFGETVELTPFWRNGNYVASLTVTDEAGNSVTEYLRIDVKLSEIEVSIGTTLYILGQVDLILKISRYLINKTIESDLIEFLDTNWFELSPLTQKIVLFILNLLKIEYEPPNELREQI